MKLTPEMLQAELEVIGRLETKISAEVGALRDEIRVLSSRVEDGNHRTDRMVDRLLEMTMIQAGNAREAVAARRVSVEASDPASVSNRDPNDDPWASKEEWPPKDHVSMSVP